MRLATWNINSVRLRIGLVERFCAEYKPDILCLQETKTVDEFFPREALAAMGFQYQYYIGMKSYNGVAILSKIPFAVPERYIRCGQEDCRHISADFGDFILHNVYIPAGGDIPDPVENPKYKHKLEFVDELMAWWPQALAAAKKPKILVGDLNIAPLEHDVWSHKQLLNVVSHTEPEVTRFAAMQQSINWVDVVRMHKPEPEKVYTWWSYRAADWQKSNRGRRLDHIWVTPDLAPQVKAIHIAADCRSWPQPSDHVPLMADFDL